MGSEDGMVWQMYSDKVGEFQCTAGVAALGATTPLEWSQGSFPPPHQTWVEEDLSQTDLG